MIQLNRKVRIKTQIKRTLGYN